MSKSCLVVPMPPRKACLRLNTTDLRGGDPLPFAAHPALRARIGRLGEAWKRGHPLRDMSDNCKGLPNARQGNYEETTVFGDWAVCFKVLLLDLMDASATNRAKTWNSPARDRYCSARELDGLCIPDVA